jgi:outer membrane protein assembly factor BamB
MDTYLTRLASRVDEAEHLPRQPRQIWVYRTGGIAMPPLKHGRRLLVAGHSVEDRPSALYCVDSQTGAELWRLQPREGGRRTLTALCGGLALFHAYNWKSPLEAWSVEDGEHRWSTDEVSPGITDLVVDRDLVFADDGGREPQAICAVNAADGSVMWRRSYGGSAVPAKTIGSRLLVIVQDDEGNWASIVAASRDTGEEEWRLPAAIAAGSAGSDEPTSLAGLSTGRGTVFCTLASGIVAAIDAETGGVRWRWTVTAGHSMPPLAAGRELLFTRGDEFVRLGVESGTEIHRSPIPNPQSPGPGVGFVTAEWYLYASGRQLIALDRRPGAVAWSWEADWPCGLPIIADGRIFMTTNGELHCLG